MPSPVKPADAQALIVTPTSSFCDGFVAVLLRLPVLFYQLINHMFTSRGEVTAAFRRQIWPPGTIMAFAGAEAPEGFLSCDGSLKAKATYADLYAAIGDNWGTGDADNFMLPDLRGRFPIGSGQATGLSVTDAEGVTTTVTGTTYALGTKGGEEDVRLDMADLPSEPPPLGDKVDKLLLKKSTNVTGDVEYALSTAATLFTARDNAHDDNADNALGELGNDERHNNVPPYSVVNYYIAT
jgi:microcystin-dependent protein